MSRKAIGTGNVALVNGALAWAREVHVDEGRSPLLFAAGYPITPVNEVTEYLSRFGRDLGVSFIQAESEIAAANMTIGAAAAGVPAFTVTSSPGISLMQEAISYAAGMELGGRGLVYVDVARGGPGLGNIQGSQADFNQAVRGGGHGDFQKIVLAPSSVQEMFDFMKRAFKWSARYRMPGFILTDGYVGQLKESYEIPDTLEKPLVIQPQNIHTSIFVREGVLEEHNWKLVRRFEEASGDAELREMEVRPYRLEDPAGPARIVLVNYGIFSRIGLGVVDRARRLGIPVGQVSLKVLNPFPTEKLKEALRRFGPVYVMEGAIDQLGERVRAALGAFPIIGSCQRPGGTLPNEKEILEDLSRLIRETDWKTYGQRLKTFMDLNFDQASLFENRGRRSETISLDECTYDVEYRAGMEGKRPETRAQSCMTDKNTYFCAGCDHRHSTEAIGTVFEALKGADLTLYSPVGCSIFLYDFFKKNHVRHIQVPHGRGPAAAAATKRGRPDSLVLCYQGDGDALDIGLGELLHASSRGENITVIVMNNGTYGMTGGQLSSATPLDQFSKTSPKGRRPDTHGYPLNLAKMLHSKGVSYFRRTLLGTPEFNQNFCQYLAEAFVHQVEGRGMSVIEVLSTCTEHQRAGEDLIEQFKQSGKKAHPIAMAREYSSKSMPLTFPLDERWGEGCDNPLERLKEKTSKRSAAANPTWAQILERFEGMGLIVKTKKESDVPQAKKAEDLRIYICGEGGQGVQSLADLMMRAAPVRYAQCSPWYEPEVTKARTVAAVTLCDRGSASPIAEPGEVDILICMTPQSFEEKKHMVKKGGLVLVDPQGGTFKNGSKEFQLVEVAGSNVAATQAKERRSANIVMLGAMNRILGFFSDAAIERTIRESMPKAADVNLAAYRAGFELSLPTRESVQV